MNLRPEVRSSAEQEILALWECAAAPAGCGLGLDRDDALLATAFAGSVPRALGQRHGLLLALRQRLFGPALTLRSDCPQCAATAEFTVDCAALQPALQVAVDVPPALCVEHAGWRAQCRAPDAFDLRAAARTAPRNDAAAIARELLQRCVLQWHSPRGLAAPDEAWPEALLEAVSLAMAAADPGATLDFELRCPACGKVWSTPLDPGSVLWSELQHHAERALLDIDALARAYGWTEPQVLALSPTRRAAYLQLVGHAA